MKPDTALAAILSGYAVLLATAIAAVVVTIRRYF